MRINLLLAALGASVLFAGAAAAAPVVLDNFDSDALALNWPGDAVFTSTGAASLSSTDLIGNPDFFDLDPGHGRYVDLDGSTGNGNDPAGVLTSVALLGPGHYSLSFDLAGNLRGAPTQTTTVSLGDFSVDLTPGASDLFTTHTYDFTTTTGGNLVFLEHGPSDQQGNLLDNVSLTAVPEPATWAMMLMGFAGLGALLRSRRRVAMAAA